MANIAIPNSDNMTLTATNDGTSSLDRVVLSSQNQALQQEVIRLKQKTRQLESQQKAKIAEVLKIKRFKEGLDKLREEAKIKFFKEAEKLEQRELDERATIRFVRNKLSTENSQL